MQSWQNGSNEARKKFTFAYQIHSFFFFKWGFTFDLSLSPFIFTVFVFFSGFVLFNGRWMKVGRVFCPSFIHHLLGFLLSYTLHTLPAASHCIPGCIVFFCNLLCSWCQSQVLKSWLNILLPTFKLWSLSSYMDVGFIQVGSSIYYKQSSYWQNHIFRSFHFKKYKRKEILVPQIKRLPNYEIG